MLSGEKALEIEDNLSNYVNESSNKGASFVDGVERSAPGSAVEKFEIDDKLNNPAK